MIRCFCWTHLTLFWWCRDKAFKYKICGCGYITKQVSDQKSGTQKPENMGTHFSWGLVSKDKKEVKNQPEMVTISLDLAFMLQVPGKSHINTVSPRTVRGTQTCDEGFCVRHYFTITRDNRRSWRHTEAGPYLSRELSLWLETGYEICGGSMFSGQWEETLDFKLHQWTSLFVWN